MTKYLVKYEIEFEGKWRYDTKFFTTDDIEAEWKAFKSFSGCDFRLLDVVDLGVCNEKM